MRLRVGPAQIFLVMAAAAGVGCRWIAPRAILVAGMRAADRRDIFETGGMELPDCGGAVVLGAVVGQWRLVTHAEALAQGAAGQLAVLFRRFSTARGALCYTRVAGSQPCRLRRPVIATPGEDDPVELASTIGTHPAQVGGGLTTFEAWRDAIAGVRWK